MKKRPGRLPKLVELSEVEPEPWEGEEDGEYEDSNQ